MKKLSILFISIFLLFSCEDKGLSKLEQIKSYSNSDLEKSYIFETMKVTYLWNKDMPSKIDFVKYKDSKSFLKGLLHRKDRWSFFMTKKENDDYGKGKYAGYGIRLGIVKDGDDDNEDDDVCIYSVYKETEFYKNGITNRGWRFVTIDNNPVTKYNIIKLLGPDVVGESHKFEMKKGGVVKIFTIQKKEFIANTVANVKVLDAGSYKVGYMFFSSFIVPSLEEFKTAFADFKSNNITKLVIDLRANGGGRVDVAEQLCKYISGSNLYGGEFSRYIFNEDLNYLNYIERFNSKSLNNQLNLKDVVFLVSGSTASSSELVITALRKNGVNVTLIGRRTHGKPTGMYGFSSTKATEFSTSGAFSRAFSNYREFAEPYEKIDIVLYAINFKGGDYFDGIPVNRIEWDDYLIPYGDRNERLLKSALDFFEGKPVQKSAKQIPQIKQLEYTGFRLLRGGAL